MVKKSKWPIVLAGGLLVLLIGVMATVVLAQTATPEATPEAGTATQDEGATGSGIRLHGLFGGLFGRHGGGIGRYGSDGDENLAEALGITVEELAAASEQAYAASLADAVAEGKITQEQADNLLAMRALKAAIDKEALLAEALGVTVEELQAALAAGTLSDLVTAQGLTAEQVQANYQTAYEAAVARAVADGVITQAQADEILSGNSGLNLFGGRGHHGRGHHHGWDGSDSTVPDTDTGTTDTAFDA